MIINQWVPAAHRGDAIGDSARRLRDILRRKGYVSDIYALTIDDDLLDEVSSFNLPQARRGDVTILHFAIPSPMGQALAELPGGRVLHYHNITPARFFMPYAPTITRMARLGRQELVELSGRVDLALGVSEYNRKELEELGFKSTAVMPLALDVDRFTTTATNLTLERVLDDGLTNILFVGRIAPNKKIEDHIRLAEHYKRYVDNYYRFIFVGRYDSIPRYYATIRALMSEYKLPPERFVFTGPVSDEELITYYRMSNAYVSLSEHEGFCVPLVEAMASNVPVLAYAAGAVPETLGGAGLLFQPKDLEFAAELLGMLVYDDEVHEAVVANQRRRLTAFGNDQTEQQLDWLVSRFS